MAGYSGYYQNLLDNGMYESQEELMALMYYRDMEYENAMREEYYRDMEYENAMREETSL